MHTHTCTHTNIQTYVVLTSSYNQKKKVEREVIAGFEPKDHLRSGGSESTSSTAHRSNAVVNVPGTQPSDMGAYTHTHIHTHTHTHIHTHTCTHTHIPTHGTHMRSHAHTHTQTYTHTAHTWRNVLVYTWWGISLSICCIYSMYVMIYIDIYAMKYSSIICQYPVLVVRV